MTAADDLDLGERFERDAFDELDEAEELEAVDRELERLGQRRLELRRQDVQRGQIRAVRTAEARGGRLAEPQRVGVPRGFVLQVPSKVPPRPDFSPPATPPDEVERLIRSRIPERFWGVTFDNLGRLRDDEGLPSLGVVDHPTLGPLRGGAAARYIAGVMRQAQKVVLLGPASGAGKSLAAAAALESEFRGGNDRAYWISARGCKNPKKLDAAVASSLLVLDNMGDELDGAVGGWLAERRAPVRDLLDQFYERRNARLVVTTWMDFDTMSAEDEQGNATAYGEATARRVYQGATVINLRLDRPAR